jgi:hypothetical protein
MVSNRVKMITAGMAVVAILGTPAAGLAQGRRLVTDDQSVALNCAPGQRARVRQTQRATTFGDARPVQRRANVEYVEIEPERSKTKTGLMIAGAAAAGAGVGGALSGTKGALIGAAIGGGSASIYEAAKRR